MFRILVFFCCAWAELAEIDENVPKPSSARKTPARRINTPIKTRTLKKADREVDFFFMSGIGYDVDGFEVSNTVCSEKRHTRVNALFSFLEPRIARISSGCFPQLQVSVYPCDSRHPWFSLFFLVPPGLSNAQMH